MDIASALQTKKGELDELQKDIDSLENQAAAIKDQVKKYNELKSKSAELKKTKKGIEKELQTVVSFLDNVDHSYVENIFPLFANQQTQETQPA